MLQECSVLVLVIVVVLAGVSRSSSDSSIGVNWGRDASHPLPPSNVVQLLKDNNVSHVRLFDADPTVLDALSGSNIQLTVGIPNSMLPHLNSSFRLARTWLHDNLTRFFALPHPSPHIRYIAVGNEPFLQAYGGKYIPFVLGAATNIQAALVKANLADHVKVIVPCSYDSFQSDSGLPSQGHFRSDLNKTMVQLLTFLSKQNSPFFASISPFHILQQDRNISLHFALFRETSHPRKDGHKLYRNSFDLSYDTLVTALSNAGFPQMEIVISQIGWPTDGAVNANSSVAETFMKGLLNHLKTKTGTPLRPHASPKEAYILSLLDEDQRSISDGNFERHWGIFTFDGQAKYWIDLGHGSKGTVNAQNVDYMSTRWCVVNNNKDMANASALGWEVCPASDCSSLDPGGSCGNLSWPANISYAFNSYYQQQDQSPESCDYDGLGLVTTVDPSIGSCRFIVQLGSSNAACLQLPSVIYHCLSRNSFASELLKLLTECQGVAGIVLPEKDEKVIAIKEGDTIALPFGVVTWWYNKEDTDLTVLFLGDTSKGHKSGQFTDFFLTGSNGIFNGFSSEFVSRAWDLPEDVGQNLVSKQSSNGIVQLPASHKMPEPKKEHRNGMALNCLEAPLDVDIKNGGRVVVLNTKNLPLVGEVGLGADLVRIDGKSMCSPGFSCDSALQVTYIIRGSGRVQVVGVDGKRVMETTLKAGDLFIVPRFFVVSKIADNDGMHWFSIISTPDPVFTHLAGRTSVWKALSAEVLEAAFNVPTDMEKLFRSKRTSDAIFFPPN
ncbi:hypothetical protein KSS87_011029 [Heliosperma pusillum]|nr:hypothetical protein KSS87_011029 [Heliosperma pusillum]